MKFISAILAASLLTAEGASAKKSASKNTAPTISDIAAQSINPGSSTGALAFTINDAQTAASSLKLSARSSNTKLVSSSKIILGGKGNKRTIKVTPTRGQSGTTTIKVTVSDGRLSASDTFLLNVNANTAPTISVIAAQTINQDSNTGTLAFTVGDAQTAAGSLNVSASSSNTSLVPNSNIVFGGSGANRTVTVTPTSGQTGTATITVTVSDGSLTRSDTFVLTVNANTAPTISDITDQGINTGGSTAAIDFTISDSQTAAVSGSSSNTTLVPNANIVFGGSGSNRTVTVTPASGQTGTATITVTVSDGSLSTSDTFVLTVNSAPTISDITAQSINQGSNTGTLAFTVGDAQTAAGSLNVSGSSSNTTLVPNANIVFGGSEANRTVTVTPASNQSGTATITVTVSDGSLSTSDTFVLTVNSAPTISDITDQGTNADGSTAAIDFTISDSQTAADSLSVSGSSSNTTLVPNANIVFGGSGANRTLTVTTASGQSGTATITVTVSDGSLTASDTFVLFGPTDAPVPTNMAFIPLGSFTMGNSVAADTDINGAPTRTVALDAFYMGKYEVAKAEWDEVRTWALSNGYSDLNEGYGKATNHPVYFIFWRDIVKWCNARSQKEGLTPVYYTDDAHTTIYKTGQQDLTNTQVKWSANGYRLPTEAEWEKAARGGLSMQSYPWGNTISPSQAKYYDDLDYATGKSPYTVPVGTFLANGYGLYDMAGNMSEWCWDRYGTYAEGSQTNPRGPTSGSQRVYRGGNWGNNFNFCKVAARVAADPGPNPPIVGFRVARSSSPIAENSALTISDITDQGINTGGSTAAIDFTISDSQTAAVSGSSSNTTLVPNANIVFGGSGANRTVTVTPASGQAGTATITVTVSDGSLTASDTFLLTVNSAEPTNMALIPQGAFTMGDSLDGMSDAPTRTVTLDAFYMGKYEVTKSGWDEVCNWGLSNGYDLSAGSGKASNHPVQSIAWYQMVKWCNARSQKEGLTPVYYTNDAQTTIYKTGDVNVTNAQVKWTANGYRLPTEAEWEKAARGGLSGKRFPWGDTISHSQANYYAYSGYSYDSSGAVNNNHPTYATGSTPYTSPVGAFAANGYGLYDMAGNVWEWCWDWYGTYAAGSQTNPRGSTSATRRVLRGGGWGLAEYCRVASRDIGPNPANSYIDVGFRVVRSSVP